MAHPTGTVTLLFSDVESSTRLWETAPTEMAAALERHEAIMRAAVGAEDGFVFKTIGDEFCVAFATATGALSATLSAQRALCAEPWPTPEPMRVRMALHTGACQERDDDYFGPTVNRAARLMAVGAGGQVLVSGATAEVLGGEVPGASLRDLGLHRLRDLGRPEHVYQLVADGLDESFGPLRSLDNPDLPNNLPALLSGFIGRERELEEVRGLASSARLVTLTGAGGSGKTRLAVQAAAELLDGSGDGVWFVELASVTDGTQVALSVATAIGLKDGLEVDTLGAVLKALAPQSALFVLDNCEHLVDDVAKLVDAVLRTCPSVHVLATSREPLGVEGERVYRVPSMSMPGDEVESLEEAGTFDAVALFASRSADAGASIRDEDASLVASVCRRLDGIPLALELAAARLSSMSLQQLSDRLDQRFRLLTGGSRNAMARQQTLQATVEWSYGLLNPVERSVLRRLSVFAGGFELDAAELVCAGDDVDEFDVLNHLHSLVEKSLVIADQDAGAVRYRLLETIRQYGASELLRDGGDDAVLEARDRHATYFLELAGRSRAELSGASLVGALARLDLERDNLRAALTHLGADPARARDVLAMIAPIDRFFRSRAAADVIPRLLDALEVVGQADDELMGESLVAAGFLTGWLQTSDPDAVVRAEAQLVRACGIADALGIEELRARAYAGVALFRQLHKDLPNCAVAMRVALEAAEASGSADVQDEVKIHSLQQRVMTALELTMPERQRRAEEVLESGRRRGDKGVQAGAFAQLALLALDQGEPARSLEMYKENIALQEELGNVHSLFPPLNNYALTLCELGLFDDAELAMRRALRLNRRMGLLQPSGDMIFAAGCIAASRGDAARAARLLGAADELRRPAYETGQLFPTDGEVKLAHDAQAAARDSLDEVAYATEYERGRLLNILEAIVLALEPRAASPA